VHVEAFLTRRDGRKPLRRLNVFDVDPNMMVPKHTDAFLNAARNDARVTRIIPPPKDPAFHFEIAQLGDFEVNPLARVTA
jgi:hypothetical protein